MSLWNTIACRLQLTDKHLMTDSEHDSRKVEDVWVTTSRWSCGCGRKLSPGERADIRATDMRHWNAGLPVSAPVVKGSTELPGNSETEQR